MKPYPYRRGHHIVAITSRVVTLLKINKLIHNINANVKFEENLSKITQVIDHKQM